MADNELLTPISKHAWVNKNAFIYIYITHAYTKLPTDHQILRHNVIMTCEEEKSKRIFGKFSEKDAFRFMVCFRGFRGPQVKYASLIFELLVVSE